jgi:hypothetical protein
LRGARPEAKGSCAILGKDKQNIVTITIKRSKGKKLRQLQNLLFIMISSMNNPIIKFYQTSFGYIALGFSHVYPWALT